MALDPSTSRSRRALLTAAVAATAATVAEAVVRPLPVAAAGDDGQVIHVGDPWNDVRSTTSLKNITNSNAVLKLETTNGIGVRGDASSGLGVFGNAESGIGVEGLTNTGNGVYGTAVGDGVAVLGEGPYGIGVHGDSETGTGVRASTTSGKALDVAGKAHFSRSGRATVTAGHRSVDVVVPGGLSGTPLCFANLRTYRSGVAVAAVRPNWPASGKIRIYLTKVLTSATSVSWLVLD